MNVNILLASLLTEGRRDSDVDVASPGDRALQRWIFDKPRHTERSHAILNVVKNLFSQFSSPTENIYNAHCE